MAVGLERHSKLVENGAALPIADRGVFECRSMALENAGQFMHPVRDPVGDPKLAGVRREDGLQYDEVPSEIRGGHHGEPEAGEGVVRIIPFGTLRVHPDSTVRNECRELREDRDQEFLCERDVYDVPLRIMNESAVGADSIGSIERSRVGAIIERDGVSRIGDQIRVIGQSIGNVGKREDAVVEPGIETSGPDLEREFEKSGQVPDLMIAPISDVAPRVVRLGRLPVDSLTSDSIGVESVGSRGVEKLRDHVVDPARIRESERLPVLEDVAPIPLVGEASFAVALLDADVEGVPRPAWIAVPTTEPDGEVLPGDPLQIRITEGCGLFDQRGAIDPYPVITRLEP